MLEALDSSSTEKRKLEMENILAGVDQFGEGNYCIIDAALAASTLIAKGLGTRFHSVIISGPLRHYNHKLGGVSATDKHIVADIDDEWVVDISCAPYNRVYIGLTDYLTRSGIEISALSGLNIEL